MHVAGFGVLLNIYLPLTFDRTKKCRLFPQPTGPFDERENEDKLMFWMNRLKKTNNITIDPFNKYTIRNFQIFKSQILFKLKIFNYVYSLNQPVYSLFFLTFLIRYLKIHSSCTPILPLVT